MSDTNAAADEPTLLHAMHGLILKSEAESLNTATTADGQTQTGVIHAGDFGGHAVVSLSYLLRSA